MSLPRAKKFPTSAFLALLIGLTSSITSAADKTSAEAPKRGIGVTPAESFRVPEGFEVELLYQVPSNSEGSWVCLTTDPKGRLLASDQYGGLYRITVKADGGVDVERLKGDFGMAHGMLSAFGSLYINVNGQPAKGKQKEVKSGIYRLTDTTGDDQYDKVEHLIELKGRGEHGPHALILSPDGKQIYIASGNTTDLPADVPHSRVPRHWSEDHLLGSMPDARGHNAGRLAPGGWVARINPDGSDFEIIATGFRNEYDIAFNPAGELFTYDADMEWDVGTPWYRPTRVNHVVSGAEFGWRNGAGKWPAYYPDSLGAVVDIGPGSPTGIAFGTGAKFPAKYQKALFICDWSFGNIFAVHMDESGSSYSGSFETFATAAPLPVTDLVVRPQDGLLYFTIGGRRTQSALYRIRYTGPESTAPVAASVDQESQALRQLRHKLESFHGSANPEAVAAAIAELGNADRNIRFAARIALEHQPVDQWRSKVLALTDPQALIHGVIALARCGEASDASAAIEALTSIKWDALSDSQRIDLLRAYGLTFIRLGTPNDAQRATILAQLDPHLPGKNVDVNRELAQVLIALDADKIAARVVDLMINAPTQEDQMRYAFALRGHEATWDADSQKAYFGWFQDAAAARGGMSFGGFLTNIRDAAIAKLSDEKKAELGDLLKTPEARDPLADLEPRDVVKEWKVEDLTADNEATKQAYDFERGKKMFAVGQCYKCHRMSGQGGILGPDLTGAGGRFSTKDLLVSIIEPDKVISDQYGATQFLTLDGKVIVGKVINLSGDRMMVLTNMMNPADQTTIIRDDIDTMGEATTSMMPAGLLDTMTAEEIRDLLAYLKAGGNPSHEIYAK